MSEIKYYGHGKKVFNDGTAYVERRGQCKVCLSTEGETSEIFGWDADHQMFVDNGDWIEVSEEHAKSLVKGAATLSETTKEVQS